MLLKKFTIEVFMVRTMEELPLPQSSRRRGKFTTPPLNSSSPGPVVLTMPVSIAALIVVLTASRLVKLPALFESVQLEERMVSASDTRAAGKVWVVLVVPR